ncbi:MAG: hypothetical protein IKW45_05435 [Clostridia bacterium]|nr:hypothetical protein [Clostridia bacterium]
MMYRIYCDRCEKEISYDKGFDIQVIKRNPAGALVLENEICEDCKKELVEWLTTEKSK